MKLTCIFFTVLLSVATYAQTLTGKIINQQNQPVPFANVLALDADSAFISGNVSAEDGTFQVTATKQASLLKISYIGYQEQIIPIQNKTDIGVIQLQEEATALGRLL